MPVPPRPQEKTITEAQMLTWLRNVDLLMTANPNITFVIGKPYLLDDGTISVVIDVYENKKRIWDTKFVFHYHKGAKKADVDNHNASKGHFKPWDGAKVRIYDHHVAFNPKLLKLYQDAVAKIKAAKI